MKAKQRALAIRLVAFATVVVGALLLGGGVAAASHVQCGDTITQDTTLDSDLTDCSGYGIVIGADHVTLDLNGHVIDGDPVTGYFGVFDRGHNYVTVENGTIQGFAYGVQLGQYRGTATGYNVVRGITTLFPRGGGIGISGLDHNVIENNHSDYFFILASNDNLIRGNHGPMTLAGGADNTIEGNQGKMFIRDTHGNVVANNDLSGPESLYVKDTYDNRFVGNHSNQGGSWFFEGSYEDVIERNILDNSYYVTGFVMYGASGDRIVRNKLTGGNGVGILLLAGSSGNDIERNDISGFRETDPYYGDQYGTSGAAIGVVEGSRANVIERNRLVDNLDGIHLKGFDQTQAVVDNHIQHNVVSENLRDGIVVDPISRGTLLFHNQTDGNGDDGIDVRVTAATLTDNSAFRNGDLGIGAVPDVIDGGGNRALFNGNPLQCLNVACK